MTAVQTVCICVRAGRTVDKTKTAHDLDMRNVGISVECWSVC